MRGPGALGMAARVWIAAGLLAASGAYAGDESGAKPAAFEEGLASVGRLLEQGRAEAGLEALRRLLGEHERQPHAYARRTEIKDLARRLAFRQHVKIPEASSVVSGKLERWSGTGEIRIVYTRPGEHDFVSSGDTLYFPMDIRGSFSLTIEGSDYPGRTRDAPVVVFGGMPGSKSAAPQTWMITFGVPPYAEGGKQVWLPASIRRFDGRDAVTVVEKEITPAKPGRSYKLEVRVTRTSISASVNGRAIGKTDKPQDVWGNLGFDAGTWERVTLSGTVEPSWIQSRIDEAVQGQRELFERGYDPRSALPAWLFEPAATAPAANPSDLSAALPERLSEVHARRLREVYEAQACDDFDEALEVVAAMREDQAPESVCCYLEARLLIAMHRAQDALAAATRCCELAPSFQDAHLLRADLLRMAGRRDEYLAAYTSALEMSPRRAHGYEAAALSLLYDGDVEGAATITRLASRHGVTSGLLGVLGGAIVKAARGPTWARTFEHKSRNYVVRSDIDKETCVQAAKVLEEAFTSYRVNLEWVGSDRTRLFEVYLFGGRAGFERYQEDLQGLMGRPSEHVAGLYSPLLKQLLIWNLPNRDEMMVTIRHEGFHQYLDRIMPDAPTWFDEGLAVYHEKPISKGGRLVFGQLHPRYVGVLQQVDLIPLKEFLYWTPRRFYAERERSYAQAWALCHLLRHGKAEHRGLFKQLVQAFQTDESSHGVMRRLLPDELVTKLDADLEAFVRDL